MCRSFVATSSLGELKWKEILSQSKRQFCYLCSVSKKSVWIKKRFKISDFFNFGSWNFEGVFEEVFEDFERDFGGAFVKAFVKVLFGEKDRKMYTNPFNRKHSTIRQVLDRLLDPTKKPIRRSESVSSSGSNSSKGSNRSFEGSSSHRGILQWGRKWMTSRHTLSSRICEREWIYLNTKGTLWIYGTIC